MIAFNIYQCLHAAFNAIFNLIFYLNLLLFSTDGLYISYANIII